MPSNAAENEVTTEALDHLFVGVKSVKSSLVFFFLQSTRQMNTKNVMHKSQVYWSFFKSGVICHAWPVVGGEIHSIT